MRANDKIVQGDFLGGEIEGGTFHGAWVPDFLLDSNEGELGAKGPSQQRAASSSIATASVHAAPESNQNPSETADETEVANLQN